MITPEDYQEGTIRAYDASPDKYVESTESLIWTRIIDELVLRADLHEGDAVLDMGCAFGRDSALFVNRGFKVTGIDRSRALLEKAHERLGTKAEFLEMDMRHLEFPDETFKAIWANAALLHLTPEDIASTLVECRRVLMPGGVLMASVKRGQGSQEFLEKFSSNDSRFFTFLEIDDMRQLFETAGLAPLEIRYENEKEQFPEKGRDMDWVYSFAKK